MRKQHCETVADGHKLPYLLIMPVQRIPRYSLLLNVCFSHHLNRININKYQ